MKAVSKKEYRKEIINYFETNSKMKISEAKKKIPKEMIYDKKYDLLENDYIKVRNVTLIYIHKKTKSGMEKGYYLRHNGIYYEKV